MKANLLFRLVLAQFLDAITFLAFYILIGPTIHAERNPIVLVLIALGGIWLLGVVKIGITLIVAYRARNNKYKPSKHRVVRYLYPRMAVILISIATASGIAGAGFNLASIIDSVIGGVYR